ncbi:MAG: GIY-YIG nuclease family protein [Candidatus Xenobia bacterium]
MSWHCYLVRCADGTLYAGIARDLEARVRVHNTGEGARYTRSRRPVELVWSEPHPDRSSASKREAWLKKCSRAERLQLIAAAATNLTP